MAKKPVTKKPASSKSKSAKRITSTTKKPSPKGRKSIPRSASSKAKPTKTKSRKAGDDEVTIDRRRKTDRRTGESSKNSAPRLERREKVQRRLHQLDRERRDRGIVHWERIQRLRNELVELLIQHEAVSGDSD